ncbi:MAG: type II secretion system GspH family protein [Chloroflexi bacterium]|nr:type II secretion system GspH family protein [Chloroflexota bacterium]
MSARRRAGFTLLEIAVALAIVGIGMVACMQVFSGSLRLQDRASRQSRAVLVARVGMDDLLMRPYDRLRNGCEDRPAGADGIRMRACVRKAGPEDGLQEPEGDLDPQLELEPRFLEVAVAWQDGAGEKTYTVRSIRLTPVDE